MLTVHQILTNAARKLKLNPPTTFVGGNTTAKSLLTSLEMCGNKLVKEYSWPVLERKHSITLVSAQSSYALPADYDRQVKQTGWNTSNKRRFLNGVTSQEFAGLENSVGNVPDFDVMRAFGWADSQLNLYTAPSPSAAGQVLDFYYISNRWMRPRTWQSGLVVTLNERIWYNGNVYTAGANGTTGATAPTHTTGSVSDGVITWTYVQDFGYTTVSADTDVPHLDDLLLTLEVIVDFGADEGFDVSKHIADRDKRLMQVKGDLAGAEIIRSFGRYKHEMAHFPETGFTGY